MAVVEPLVMGLLSSVGLGSLGDSFVSLWAERLKSSDRVVMVYRSWLRLVANRRHYSSRHFC